MIRWFLFFASLTSASAANAGEASAVEKLASAVWARAQSEKIEGPVGIFVNGESAALARAFSTVLIAKASEAKLAGVPIDAMDFAAAETAARKIGTRSLIRIELFVSDRQLRARGDLISTWVNFWSGRIPTRAPRPAAILEAEVPADSLALALATPGLKPAPNSAATPALRLSVDKIASTAAFISALAVGDIDGDGVSEVVALTENELLAWDASGRLLARKSIAEIPPAPSRCREPFGSLVVLSGPPRVAYASANRLHGEIVAFDSAASAFRSLESLREAPLAIWQGKLLSAAPLPGQNLFASALHLDGNKFAELKRSFQTCSTFSDAGKEWQLVTFPDGTGSLYPRGLDSSPAHHFTGLGAAAILVDLKATGSLEIASTSSEYEPAQDELRVWSIPKGSAPTAAISLGPGKAWYAARLPAASGADRVVVGILRPEGTTDLLQVRAAP